MKKYIYSILALVLFCLVGCNDELGTALNHDGDVRFSIKTTSKTLVRATIEDTPVEERIDWVDVFIFNEDKSIFYKERVDVSNEPVYKSGEFTIQKKRDEFGKNKHYYVYLVANASQDLTSAESNVTTWNDLQALVQFDNNMHLSAFVDSKGKPAFANAPARFLMDGFVYVGSTSGSVTPPKEMNTCVINNPDVKELLLCGTLYRAAAKFIINIKQGGSVEFHKSLVNPLDNATKTPQYYINQLPSSTRVLPPAEGDNFKPTTQNSTPMGLNDHSFTWNDSNNSMIITGYSYADDWSKLEYTKQASILFNIPMKWDKDKLLSNGKEQVSADNWYKIPLSKTKSFNRNTCYIINITVNAVGAEEKEYAVELDSIEYTTHPWEEKYVNLGGYNAAFLTLNTELIKIYDKNIDTDQLTFTSSSPIKSIKLKDTFSHNEQNGEFEMGDIVIGANGLPTGEYNGTDGFYAYYIDKFGQKRQLGTDPGFDIKVVEQPEWTKEQILAKEANLYKKEGVADNAQYIRAEVWDEHKRALNGNITIHSPILPVDTVEDLNWPSHFNTVRYLEYEVENEQGITATFRVEQRPITVISNVEGYFSYRDDFRIGDDPVQHNPVDFPNDPFGQIKPVDQGPLHYLNPGSPFFAISGFLPYHDHEVAPDGDILYSCTSHVDYEEMVYGFMYRDYYRSWGPGLGTFHRAHYYYEENANGVRAHFNSSDKTATDKYYQALTSVFPKTVNGETKYYRRHFSGNFFVIFYAKFVNHVYKEDNAAKGRKAGQADIYTVLPDDSNPYNWNGWVARQRQKPNHRMYQVRVTSTSNEYIVANPQLIDDEGKITNDRSRGLTAEGSVNARTVSPSFMVASQLGESFLPQGTMEYKQPDMPFFYKHAKKHCQEYVEAHYDDLNANGKYDAGKSGVSGDLGEPVYHYNDWRLPTAAEIDYLVTHQSSSRAMDVVLSEQYYFHASKTPGVYTKSTILSDEIPNYGTAGWYMRCVRDSYIEPEPVYYDEDHNVLQVGK